MNTRNTKLAMKALRVLLATTLVFGATAGTAQQVEAATLAPASASYLVPLKAYTYAALPASLVETLRSAFRRSLDDGTFSELAARDVIKGKKRVAIAVVLVASPRLTSVRGWEAMYLAAVRAASVHPSRTVKLAKLQGVLVNDPSLRLLTWAQGRYVVALYGIDARQMEQLAVALVKAKR